MATARTRVYLTVDAECAEERVTNGSFSPARGYDLRVWGRLRHHPEALGVPLITAELAHANLTATFFVEPFGSSFFGESELAKVCAFLTESGQDIQLHAHPVQRTIDWYSRREERPSDDMAAYSLAVQVALLREGMAILDRCGVPRSSLYAFRAGNFGASNDTWRAMAVVGLTISSNFNLCYLDKTCRILWGTPANSLFDTGEGVWELPVSNFFDRRGHFRHLQISAVSFPEMRHALLEIHRIGLPEVTILTHPFEYFFVDSVTEKSGRPNVVNIERLRHLCAFLRERSDLFEVETLSKLAGRLKAGEARAQTPNAVVPRGRTMLRYGRFAEQAYQRLAARLAL